MTTNKLTTGVRSLNPADKKLLLAFFAISVLALTLGIFYGAMTAAGRTGLFAIDEGTSYKFLGLHGVTIFFYWLYFVQAGFVLLLASVYTEGAGTIAWRPVAWVGFIAMLAGLVFSELSYVGGTTVLYDGNPTLLNNDPAEGQSFYLGYVLLSAGLFLVATSAIATALRPKFAGVIESWSPIRFATVAWSGLLMVGAIAGANPFLPPLPWPFGLGEVGREHPAVARTRSRGQEERGAVDRPGGADVLAHEDVRLDVLARPEPTIEVDHPQVIANRARRVTLDQPAGVVADIAVLFALSGFRGRAAAQGSAR